MNYLDKKNIYLFEMYQDFYKGEDFHRHMNFEEFLKDPDVYKQIVYLFYNDTNLKNWYLYKYKGEVRKQKMSRIV